MLHGKPFTASANGSKLLPAGRACVVSLRLSSAQFSPCGPAEARQRATRFAKRQAWFRSRQGSHYMNKICRRAMRPCALTGHCCLAAAQEAPGRPGRTWQAHRAHRAAHWAATAAAVSWSMAGARRGVGGVGRGASHASAMRQRFGGSGVRGLGSVGRWVEGRARPALRSASPVCGAQGDAKAYAPRPSCTILQGSPSRQWALLRFYRRQSLEPLIAIQKMGNSDLYQIFIVGLF